MQKLKGRRPKRRLDRDEDIRDYVEPFINRLFELYEETDPSKGRVSESDKLPVGTTSDPHLQIARTLSLQLKADVGHARYSCDPGEGLLESSAVLEPLLLTRRCLRQ